MGMNESKKDKGQKKTHIDIEYRRGNTNMDAEASKDRAEISRLFLCISNDYHEFRVGRPISIPHSKTE